MIVWLGLIALIFVAIVYLFVSIGGILWPGGPQLPPDAARNLSLALLLVMLLLCGVVFGGLLNAITSTVAQAEPTRIAQATQSAATMTLVTPTPNVPTITIANTPTHNAVTSSVEATQTAEAQRATLNIESTRNAATQTVAANQTQTASVSRASASATANAQATLDTSARQTAIAATLNAGATRNAATQTVVAGQTVGAVNASATINTQATINAAVRQTAIIVTLNAVATNNAATQTSDAGDSESANASATANAQATLNAQIIQTAVAGTSAVLSTINAATQTAIANQVGRTQTPLALTATALATQRTVTATPSARPTPSPTRAGTPTPTITALPIDPIVLIDTVLRGVIERANQAEIDALLSDDDRQLEPWWDEQALDRVKVNVQNVRGRFINVTDVQWEPIGDGIRLITSSVTTATYVTSERWTFVGTINFACANGALAQRRYVEDYPAEQYMLQLRETVISVVQWNIGRAVVREISPPICP